MSVLPSRLGVKMPVDPAAAVPLLSAVMPTDRIPPASVEPAGGAVAPKGEERLGKRCRGRRNGSGQQQQYRRPPPRSVRLSQHDRNGYERQRNQGNQRTTGYGGPA